MEYEACSFLAEVPMRSIREFIDTDIPPTNTFPGRLPTAHTYKTNLMAALNALLAKGIQPLANDYIIDIRSSVGRGPHYMHGVLPCLTRSRGSAGHWLTWKQRFMNLHEVLLLMGVPPHRVMGVVLEATLGRIAGNAIPVPLVQRVIANLMHAAGL